MEPAKEPVAGSIWRYNRSGKNYQITEIVNVKEEGGAAWKAGVKYSTLDNSHLLSYVRFLSDFLNKFTYIGDADANRAGEQDLRDRETHWVEPGKN